MRDGWDGLRGCAEALSGGEPPCTPPAASQPSPCWRGRERTWKENQFSSSRWDSRAVGEEFLCGERWGVRGRRPLGEHERIG